MLDFFQSSGAGSVQFLPQYTHCGVWASLAGCQFLGVGYEVPVHLSRCPWSWSFGRSLRGGELSGGSGRGLVCARGFPVLISDIGLAIAMFVLGTNLAMMMSASKRTTKTLRRILHVSNAISLKPSNRRLTQNWHRQEHNHRLSQWCRFQKQICDC